MKTVIDVIDTIVSKIKDEELKVAICTLCSGGRAALVAEIERDFTGKFPESMFPVEGCRQALYKEAALRWASAKEERTS